MPSLLSRLFGSTPAQKSSRGVYLAMHPLGGMRWSPRDFATLTRESYERNAVAYRAVRMIAEGAASVPWRLYEGDTEVEAHPLLDLVRRPNDAMTGTDLIEALVSNLLLFGNAYLEVLRVDRTPRELFVLRPDRMSVLAGQDGWPAGYEYTVAGRTIRYDVARDGQSPVLHLKLFNPLDDHYGLPPLAARRCTSCTRHAQFCGLLEQGTARQRRATFRRAGLRWARRRAFDRRAVFASPR